MQKNPQDIYFQYFYSLLCSLSHYYLEINTKMQLIALLCETKSKNYIIACYKVHK